MFKAKKLIKKICKTLKKKTIFTDEKNEENLNNFYGKLINI